MLGDEVTSSSMPMVPRAVTLMALSGGASADKAGEKGDKPMGTGIVFVYILLAAIAAPAIWMLWWGLDSALTGPSPRRRAS